MGYQSALVCGPQRGDNPENTHPVPVCQTVAKRVLVQFDCGTRILRVISRAGRPCQFWQTGSAPLSLARRVPLINSEVSIEFRIRDRLVSATGPMDFYCANCAGVSQAGDNSGIACGQVATGSRRIKHLPAATAVRNDYPRAEAVAVRFRTHEPNPQPVIFCSIVV